MISISKKLEMETRREIERKLVSLGLTQQDIAAALGIDGSSVRNDLKVIGNVRVIFDTTNLTNVQRRDKAFHHAMLEWLDASDIFDYSSRLGMDLKVAKGVVEALSIYLNMRHVGGIVEGLILTITSLVNPVDPPEYKPYRELLRQIFGQHSIKIPRGYLLGGFYRHLINHKVELTRDSFPGELVEWVLKDYRHNFSMPFNKTFRDTVDKVVATLLSERVEKVICMRFGLSLERSYSLKEVASLFGVTPEGVRQIEKKGLRELRHPFRSRQLEVFLQSPFDIAQRSIEKMSALSVPLVLPVVPEKEMRQVESVDKILAKSVEELEISVRSYNVLKNNGIYNVADLVQLTIDQSGMLDLKWCGRKSVKELKEILESMGLSFGMRVKNGVLVRPVTETED